MSSNLLAGQHIVITGGAGALGRVVAGTALAQGARVTVLDRSDADLGTGIACVRVDLGDAAAVQSAFARLVPVDTVCALAGGFAMGAKSFAADDEEWTAMRNANVVSLRHVLKAVVPRMVARDAGRIITVCALAAQQGKPYRSA